MTCISYNDDIYEGMACSREFSEWLLKMNDTLDFPVKSYYKLIRLFCRTQYKELMLEEARKANELFYNLTENEEKLTMKSSYDLVFIPYEENVKTFAPIPVNEPVLGYRILQTRGYLPGSYYNELPRDYNSMQYIVDLFCHRNTSTEKLEVKNGKLTDTYTLYEFQSAEMTSFIDNQMPYSYGPSCPDRMLCYNTHFNILSHLMKDVDSLQLVDKDSEHYELRLVSVVSELLCAIWDEANIMDKKKILDSANDRYLAYMNENEQNVSLDELCCKIKSGYKKRVIIEINYSKTINFDADWHDMEITPVGLTNEDYESFSRCSHRDGSFDCS